MKRILFLLILVPALALAEPMISPTWGFKMDLPEGYEYAGGDGKDRFSFSGPGGTMFDIVVYNGVYGSVKELAEDAAKRIGNRGDVDYFQYGDKQAAIMELAFDKSGGWGLCVELAGSAAGTKRPMLLALAYGPADNRGLHLFHFSALDSIVPSEDERRSPGPITEYGYPRGEMKQAALGSSGINAMIRENDAEAAQALVEREFNVLKSYVSTANWQKAWLRYYRLIYRDSFGRIADAAAALVSSWGGNALGNAEAKMRFAQRALAFVQGFKYERHPEGSDFVNLVSAVTEGRGDCDSRAMLWAMILANADIQAAMMVSPKHSHAMGLADIDGTGARFEAYGIKWLVAETTANVNIGLIAEDVSDPAAWLGVVFE